MALAGDQSDTDAVHRFLVAIVVLACAGAVPATASAHHPGAAPPAGAASAGAPVLGDHGDVLPPAADLALRSSARRRALAAPGAVGVAAPADELAATWCGPDTTTDDTAHASSAGPRFKVIYASPSDEPSRFDALDDVIQADARAISALVASTAGGQRTLRFDTGTSCGPRYLDLMNVRLPRTRAAYLAGDLDARTDRLEADLAPALATVGGTRNALVYADGLYGGDGIAGYASFWLDDRPGAVNWSNRGGLFAFVFGSASNPGFVTPRRTSVLHELAHTLGAVQDSAPNATGMGHCTDEYDVLCYADGGPQNTMTWDCGSAAESLFDCGADDYFAAAPAAGSYLATHWNLFDSAFLCPVGECVTAEAEPVTGEPPVPGPAPADPSALDPPAGEPPAVPPSAATPPPADPGATEPPPGDEGRAPGDAVDGDAAAADLSTASRPASRVAASAVRRTRDAVRAALRRRGLRSLSAAFAAPAAGRVSVTVTHRGRAVATASRRVQRGRARLSVRLTARGRRLARTARHPALAVRVTFTPTRGATVTATRRV